MIYIYIYMQRWAGASLIAPLRRQGTFKTGGTNSQNKRRNGTRRT